MTTLYIATKNLDGKTELWIETDAARIPAHTLVETSPAHFMSNPFAWDGLAEAVMAEWGTEFDVEHSAATVTQTGCINGVYVVFMPEFNQAEVRGRNGATTYPARSYAEASLYAQGIVDPFLTDLL